MYNEISMQGFARNFTKEFMFELDRKIFRSNFQLDRGVELESMQTDRGNRICKCMENIWEDSLEHKTQKPSNNDARKICWDLVVRQFLAVPLFGINPIGGRELAEFKRTLPINLQRKTSHRVCSFITICEVSKVLVMFSSQNRGS